MQKKKNIVVFLKVCHVCVNWIILRELQLLPRKYINVRGMHGEALCAACDDERQSNVLLLVFTERA